MEKTKFKTIVEYIGTFPSHIHEQLEKIRQTIRAANPEAEEGISYNVPAFRFKGILVHFSAFNNHNGFFPTPVWC